MADVSKITVPELLEPNGEPEFVENNQRIMNLFYGSSHGDLIEELDEEEVAGVLALVEHYGLVPMLVEFSHVIAQINDAMESMASGS